MIGKELTELRKEIDDCERTLTSIGSVNLRALEIYDAVENEYNSLINKKIVVRLKIIFFTYL